MISYELYNLSQSIFSKVRQGIMSDVTLEDVKNILRQKVRQTLKHIHHYEYDTNIYDSDELQERIERINQKENQLKDNLKRDYKGTIQRIENEIDNILLKQNLESDKKNLEYKSLVRKWTDLKILRESWKRELITGKGRTDEEFIGELEEQWKLGLFESVERQGNDSEERFKNVKESVPDYKDEPSPLFSSVYQEHLTELRNNQRRPDTISETEETYKDLIEFIGDKPIDQYTRVDGRTYRKHLEKLPKNRKRVSKYRDKTLKEIHSSPVPLKDRISKDTQIKLISRMTSCWNFLIDEYPEFVTDNVFKKKSQNVSVRKQKDKRQSFTESDLRIIFDHKFYLPEIFENPYHKIHYPYYWIPIFSCLSGCRIEEICMMRPKDVLKVKDVWVYRIREEGEYTEEVTKVKSPYSERDIPLHPILIDLGFVRYVQKMKKLGYERVFHELRQLRTTKNIFHKNVSRWFNERYLKKIGLKNDSRKISFHSFRHSMETHLTNKNVNTRFIDYLQGHSLRGVGGSVYMKSIDPDVLLEECIMKIKFDVDFQKLIIKFSKID